ncbi:MAG: hypothetical protein ACRYF4_03195 [Janthinobacterium lividum]
MFASLIGRYGSRLLHVSALLFSALYFGGISLYLSSHRLMWADEFTGFFVMTDPSWRHAYQSWSRAADSGGPLFYLLGHSLVSVFGPHPYVLRLFSAACLWMAAVLWFEVLRRKLSTLPALTACGLVWLCNSLFVDHLGQVRYYGLLVLATAVAAILMIWVEDHAPRAIVCFLLMYAGSSFLITSHMLGVVFSSFVVAAMLFSRLPRTKKAAAIAGALASWSLILLFRTAIHAGSAAYTWVQMPHATDLLRYYLHTPFYVSSHPVLSNLVNTLLALLIVCGAFLAKRKLTRNGPGDSGRRLMLIFSALLLCLPLGMFVLSHAYKPVWVGRYLMPYGLGVAGMCAGALWFAGDQLSKKTYHLRKRAFAVGACFLIIALHMLTLREQRLIPYANIRPYLAASVRLPLVLQDADPFLESRYYAASEGSNLYFVLSRREHGTLNAVLESDYQPGLMYDDDFFLAHQKFLYLDIPWARGPFLERWKAQHPDWRIRRVGDLPYQGTSAPLLEVNQ